MLLAILGLAACGEEDDTSATGGRAGDETVGDSPSPTTASPADGGGDADDTTADGDAAEGGGDEDPPLADWPDTPLTLLTVAELEQPIALVARPGSDDLWVAERPGRVRLIERSIDAAADTEEIRLVDQPVVDMTDQISTDGEGGLLALYAAALDMAAYVDEAGFDTVSVSEHHGV